MRATSGHEELGQIPLAGILETGKFGILAVVPELQSGIDPK